MASLPELQCMQLQDLILNARKPLILRNFQHNWKCFQGTLEQWCKTYTDALSNKSIAFEQMDRNYCVTPQWERKRKTVKMTINEFLDEHTSDKDYWTALNYKRNFEIPQACREGINFECLGFPKALNDFSFWLSSKGANTPCHYDAYGCNIVVQIYGKKSWLLFPPDTPLTSTRIPYEESSVYCLENFYAPSDKDLSEFESLKHRAFHCVLEPNDVLVVPHNWWHYVEAVETSLSVNTWIPLEVDIDKRIDECIVKFLMESFVTNSAAEVSKYVLNPNQMEDITEESELFRILEHIIDAVDKNNFSDNNRKKMDWYFSYHYLSQEDFEVLLKSSEPKFNELAAATVLEFKKFIEGNAKRYKPLNSEHDRSPLEVIKETLLNSICSPDVIKCVKKQLLSRTKKCLVK